MSSARGVRLFRFRKPPVNLGSGASPVRSCFKVLILSALGLRCTAANTSRVMQLAFTASLLERRVKTSQASGAERLCPVRATKRILRSVKAGYKFAARRQRSRASAHARGAMHAPTINARCHAESACNIFPVRAGSGCKSATVCITRARLRCSIHDVNQRLPPRCALPPLHFGGQVGGQAATIVQSASRVFAASGVNSGICSGDLLQVSTGLRSTTPCSMLAPRQRPTRAEFT